jgi:putative component of membrane protein insertase Oxa1/YidC/SpoIIIJ protein YidD
MGGLLKTIIYLYRILIKPFYKRTCIFRTSCSQEVLNEINRDGFIAGWKALKLRMNYCKPGYTLTKNPQTGKPRIVFKDGRFLEGSEISDHLTKISSE